jgi:tRNA A-37 threonylcarbamoyl transferase component Bud32
MAAAPSLELGAVVAVLSGLAVAALGLAVVAAVRPRSPASVAFAAFALLWGGQVAAANLTVFPQVPGGPLAWYGLNLALTILYPAPLLAFAALYPRAPGPLGRPGVLAALLGGPSLLVLGLLFLAPSLFVARAALGPTGQLSIVAGPLLEPLALTAGYLVFLASLAALGVRFLRSPPGAGREQLGLLVVALVVFTGYRAVDIAGRRLTGPAAGDPAALVLYGGLLLAGAAAIAVLVARTRGSPGWPWAGLLLAAAVVPPFVGVAEAVLRAQGVTAFYSVGIWRLAAVALLAYAILRYRVFDVELRLQRVAPSALYGVVVAAGVALLWGALPNPLGASMPLALLTLVGVAAAAAPLVRLGQAGLRRAAPHLEDPDYLYRRKVDVYRAALEEARRRRADATPSEARFLTDLRRGLGISDAEHRLLLALLEAEGSRALGPRAPSSAARFQVLRQLGEGGAGRALLARDTVLGREVVLKQALLPDLDAEAREAFLAEARLAARIQHPNVVGVHEVLLDEQPPTLVLEYVAGGSLEDLLRAQGPLPPARAVALGLDVLAGLERIHAAGIVHRDIKPANILLTPEGVAKVTDFGVARGPPEARLHTLAVTGWQPGSLAYMSPEQARGEAVDARSDLFAVGVVLYEAMAGRPHISPGAHEFAIRQRVQVEPSEPLPEAPPTVAAVVLQALAKDPAARFPSAAAMAGALRTAAAAPPGAAAPIEPAGPAGGPPGQGDPDTWRRDGGVRSAARRASAKKP